MVKKAWVRGIGSYIQRDLGRKMVFLGGPRQVGKTTLARSLLQQSEKGGRYFNWDLDEDRQAVLNKRWSKMDHLLVFDELHKFHRWKIWAKGVFDVYGNQHQILVTGSARLDVYRKGGDSLVGRYHYWRLHPFTLDEVPSEINPEIAFERLMSLGGFPEPFLSGDEREARRWRRARLDQVIREDIRDLETVRNIQGLSVFLDMLRSRVGGMVVLSNLAEDLQIAPQTAKAWLEVIERMYLVFRVAPYAGTIPRAIRKPPKVYFFDNGDVIGGPGKKFENLIATLLLKRLHFIEDFEGYRCELRYIRDKEGREVDFAVFVDGTLEELIEVKYKEETVSRSLIYYTERLKPKRAYQLVAGLEKPYDRGNIRILSPLQYVEEREARSQSLGSGS